MVLLGDNTRQLIKDSVDAELLLKALGFQVSKTSSSEVRAPCKLHGGDNPTAFSMRTDTKTWCCFTKHCEQDSLGKADNDLIALVRKCNGVSFTEALKFLCGFSGINLDLVNLSSAETNEGRRKRDNENFIKTQKRRTARTQALPQLSEDIVHNYIVNRDDYFLKAGFLPSTLEFFEIGSTFDRVGVRRATIPIRDAQGNLVSISARREDGNEEPRYLLEKLFKKGSTLYNLHVAIQSKKDTVIVVEGFKALWAVYEAGFTNVVACMGSMVTEDQVLALCLAGFSNCVLLLDGDEAGQSGTLKSEKRLKKAFKVTPIYLSEGESPDNYLRLDLRNLLEFYLETL